MVWPHDSTLAIAYGSTQFKWLTGPWVVTKVAALEDDIEPFAARRLSNDVRGSTQSLYHPGSPAPRPVAMAPTGHLIEIECEGLTWVAELLDEDAPEYATAVWDALPLEGITTLTNSSGEIIHVWCAVPPRKAPTNAPKSIPVER